ncbi:MAG: TldD/PmbA family protein [Deltaproteobacteria bacterium]|nr:MAG: TldD/PmbA family protein [Deltaproteobacteria bacterium]
MRQGGAQPGHPRGPRRPRLPVHGCRRVRRCRVIESRHLEQLAAHAFEGLAPGEDLLLSLQAEDSDFVRFNRGRVRQPGSVAQADLQLRLIEGQRHASIELSLSGVLDTDRRRIDDAMEMLRPIVASAPPDPHLLWATDPVHVHHEAPGAPPDALTIARDVVDLAQGQDLVGILVSGSVASGFMSSRGQRCWDVRHSTMLDWCLVHQGDKAVKSLVANTGWDPAEVAEAMDAARSQLALLQRPPKKLEPGRYRCLLSPSALGEVMELLCWGGFSERGLRTRMSPLTRLRDGSDRLSPRVTVYEDTAHGLGPPFSDKGFIKPPRVGLIEHGTLVGSMVSPRSAQEYGLQTNGAADHESPEALVMEPGTLQDREALQRLGTGLYVSNLWYLNYSDRPAGRITGMTRFATLWVEDGEPVAPTEVMRFDESIFHLLGGGLEALGDSLALLPSTSTYERRSTSSMRLPTALIDGVRFTL